MNDVLLALDVISKAFPEVLRNLNPLKPKAVEVDHLLQKLREEPTRD